MIKTSAHIQYFRNNRQCCKFLTLQTLQLTYPLSFSHHTQIFRQKKTYTNIDMTFDLLVFLVCLSLKKN